MATCAAIVFGLARRARLTSLMKRYDSTLVLAVFAFVNGLIAIGVMSLIAFVTGEPFIFPSLGPTAFLLFYTPLVVAACPRNTICGHAIAAGAGYLSLGIFHEPRQLVILMLAVVFLVVQGFVINRLAGIPYPMWSPGQAET